MLGLLTVEQFLVSVLTVLLHLFISVKVCDCFPFSQTDHSPGCHFGTHGVGVGVQDCVSLTGLVDDGVLQLFVSE